MVTMDHSRIGSRQYPMDTIIVTFDDPEQSTGPHARRLRLTKPSAQFLGNYTYDHIV